MSIRYVQGHGRAADDQSGEYLLPETWHYQSPTRDYSIYDANGTKICAATVEQEAVDLTSGGDGRVALYKVRVLRLNELSVDGTSSKVDDASAPIAAKFVRFLTVYLADHPDVRFSAEITFDLGGDWTH